MTSITKVFGFWWLLRWNTSSFKAGNCEVLNPSRWDHSRFSIPSPWWHGFERRVVSFHFISSEKLIPKPNKWDKSNQNPGCRKFNSQSCLSCLHRVGMVSKREKGHSPLWHLKKSWNTPLACFEKLFGVAIEQCKYSFVRMFFSIQFSFSETHHITSPS